MGQPLNAFAPIDCTLGGAREAFVEFVKGEVLNARLDLSLFLDLANGQYDDALGELVSLIGTMILDLFLTPEGQQFLFYVGGQALITLIGANIFAPIIIASKVASMIFSLVDAARVIWDVGAGHCDLPFTITMPGIGEVTIGACPASLRPRAGRNACFAPA